MKEPYESTNNGKECWVVDLREVGAGRKYFATKETARTFWLDCLVEQKQYGQIAFDLPLETRRRYMAAESRLAARGATLEQVLDWWERSKAPEAEKLVSDAIAACLDAKAKSGCRAGYLKQLRLSLHSFLPVAGTLNCSAVTLAQIEGWLANPKWGPEARRGHTSRISTLFGFALKQGWVLSNPALRLERVRTDERKPSILTVKQVQRLFSTAQNTDPDLIPFLTLCVFCGVRNSEVVRVQWDQVNLARGIVEITGEQSKTRDRRIIQLQLNAIAWLKLGGRLPPKDWQGKFERLRKAAGWAVTTKRGQPWPQNVMRHSFCSYALPIFHAAQTAAWAGHGESVLFKHYRELVTVDDARAFWSILPA